MTINKGYVFSIVAVVLYALADAIVKYYVTDYDVTNVMFVRTLARFSPFILLAIFQGVNPYKTKNVKNNIFRSLCSLGVGFAFLFAYKFAPMTDVVVVSQASSIIVIPLSIMFLKERFNVYTTCAILLGFLGIAFAFRPSGNVLQLGVLFALIAAILSASSAVLSKKLTSSDSELTIIFYQQTFVLLASISGCNIQAMPTPVIVCLLLSGIISALALYLKIHAYKFANCSYISSTAYFILIPTTIIDFWVYDKSPDAYIIAGAALIIAGCVIANIKK